MIEPETQKLLRGQQWHACLLGSAVTFSLVALHAGRDEIRRGAFTTLCSRQDVIERQVLRVAMITAVLAAIAVANVDTRTLHRRLTAIAPHMNIVSQPNDGRNRKRCRRRMENIVAVVLFDKHRAAKPKAHRTSDADSTERLVRKVQQ